MSPEVSMTCTAKIRSIICKDCNREFIHMAVFREEAETYTCVDAENVTILQQTGVHFCPYCGNDQKRTNNDE